MILLHLWLDRWRFLNTPLILADLGQHQMIIGRRWLAEKDVRLDVKNSAFLWPAEPSDLEKALPAPRLVPRRVLQRPMPSPLHQQDEERRDRALDEEIASEKSVQTAAARALEGRTHRGRACGKLNVRPTATTWRK